MKLRHKSNAPALEWLADVSGKSARITSVGNHALLVENHCGIRKYAMDEIRLATGCGCVRVIGEQLRLSEVRADALIIRGGIRSVELPCGGVENDEA